MRGCLIPIGKILRPQGKKGEVRIIPYLNNLDQYKRVKEVFIIGEDCREVRYRVIGIRYQGRYIIIHLNGFNSIDKAETITGREIDVPKEWLDPLPEGHYYYSDIEGLDVYDEGGQYYGKITDIFSTGEGSNDVYIVKDKEREIFIPAIHDVIKDIDIEKKKIIIHLMEGLVD
ncbi:MAG: 16S rRNA processing protein RimM [Nitrospinae bacterium]|nr:16S rRNA processing protein RimM [Nitrospinota bacterium]